jgi:predicted nucleic acid-binding protein
MVTAAEAMVRPAAAGPAELGRMRAYLGGFPHLELVPVDLEIATAAAAVRARARLKTPDALIVATALVRGADAIVANDASWKDRMPLIDSRLRAVDLYAILHQ